MVKFRLGLGGGRDPEVYSHDRCRLVGWLDRSSRVVPNVLVWLAELGEWRGRGPMSTPAGRDGWVISGRKGQKVKGSWVSCRGSSVWGHYPLVRMDSLVVASYLSGHGTC